MFFFTKKSSSFSLTGLLEFDFEKIDFQSVFPYENYANFFLAVAVSQQQPARLLLLNDNQGSNDPVLNKMMEKKLTELQLAIQQQDPARQVEAGWLHENSAADQFIYLNSAMPMSDVLDDVFQSHVRQRRPILVDVERSALLTDKPSRLIALMARDAFFQVNFLSLTGYHGDVAKRLAFRLLHAGKVAYLGFRMEDFQILARNDKTKLDTTIVNLLTDQTKQRMKQR